MERQETMDYAAVVREYRTNGGGLKMKDMAAEYEAKIAALEKKDKGHRGGNAGSSSRKKPGTLTFNTKEEAVAALEEANKKAMRKDINIDSLMPHIWHK